jgi:polar amino acid transport system substrate-binding protein
MRRSFSLALPALGVAVLALAGCSSASSDATSESGVPLIAEGKLTVCTNPPYEPFEFKEGDQIVGLDIDIVQEVANDLGVELALVETGFDGIQSGAALNAGSCDLVASGITITEEREGKLDFSDPYFDANQGLLVPAGSDLDSLESLAGVTVGVQQATTGETFAADNALNAVQFEDLGLQIQALKNGQVEAIINDIAVLGPYVDESFVIGTQFETGEQYGLGVKTGNTALLDAVNGTLERIATDGTYDEIYARWITPAAS